MSTEHAATDPYLASPRILFVLKCNIRWCSDIRNVDKAHGLIWQTNLPLQKHRLRHKRLEDLHSADQEKVSACPDVILWEAGKNSYLAKKQWHAVKNGIDWWKTYKAFTQGGWKCSHVNFIQRWIKCKIALKWKRVVFICHSFLCSQTWVLFSFWFQ